MIYVNCGAQQNEVIQMLESNNEKFSFKFIEKKGIKLIFEVNTADLDAAVETAKQIIKASALGKALYFQVSK